MKPLLLLVGKSPSTIDLLNHIFTTRYRTATYTTASKALSYLETASETDRPAVVICDQSAPDDTTPVEVFRGLKNHQQHELLPIMVLCADCESTDGSTELNDLCWAEKICKPFNPEDLTMRVRQLLALNQ